ncbi:MAG: DEAD/DEAH box helicase, partial [Dehalococcoidia bacterium]|nr:DEAD/DEAH box helicase [Dehalococcoidia bacterium]
MKLRPFQQQDIERIAHASYVALLASSQGTGKTAIALGCVGKEPARLLPALVVCPASVADNWKKETGAWLPWARVYVIDGETDPVPHNAHLVVCSWSLLAHREAEMMRHGFRFVIADEFHYAKAGTSQRSLAIQAVFDAVRYKIGLTGTPLINNPRELEDLCAFFKTPGLLVIRRLLEDVAPEIPPKTRAYTEVALAPRVLREYRRAERDFETWLQARLLDADVDGLIEDIDAETEATLSAEALVKVGYLRRILAVGKVPAVADWIARAVRLGEPVVVFAEHQEVIAKLSHTLRKYRLKHGILDGSTPARERQALVDNFQAGLFPVFIGSKAAKEGITLTRARNVVFAERYWTSAEEEQSEDRLHRIGQRFSVRAWFPHVPGTIDDRMAEIVEQKREIMRDAIGLSEVADDDVDAVRRLLRSWNARTGAPRVMQGPLLGYGVPPLPPLPSPRITCALLFDATRWTNPRGV